MELTPTLILNLALLIVPPVALAVSYTHLANLSTEELHRLLDILTEVKTDD